MLSEGVCLSVCSVGVSIFFYFICAILCAGRVWMDIFLSCFSALPFSVVILYILLTFYAAGLVLICVRVPASGPSTAIYQWKDGRLSTNINLT